MATAQGRQYIGSTQFTNLKDHVVHLVKKEGKFGATTPELVRHINGQVPGATYSNPVSGALSRLHNVDRRLVRLKKKRGGFNVYVHKDYVNGRDFYPARPPQGVENDRLTPELVEDVLRGLKELTQPTPGQTVTGLKQTLNAVWTDAHVHGDVSKLQAAADRSRP